MLEILNLTPDTGADVPNLIPYIGYNFSTGSTAQATLNPTVISPMPPLIDGNRGKFDPAIYPKVADVSGLNAVTPTNYATVGTGDYTLEMWINITASSTTFNIFSISYRNIPFQVGVSSGKLEVAIDATWSASTLNVQLPGNNQIANIMNRPLHLVVQRKAGKVWVYLDGKRAKMKVSTDNSGIYQPEWGSAQSYTSATAITMSDRSVVFAEFAFHNVARYDGEFKPPMPMVIPE